MITKLCGTLTNVQVSRRPDSIWQNFMKVEFMYGMQAAWAFQPLPTNKNLNETGDSQSALQMGFWASLKWGIEGEELTSWVY